VEAAETLAPVVKSVSAEAVVGEEGTSPPSLVAVEVEGVEAHVLDEPAAVAQKSAIPETVARATTPEIQVAEETGASLSQSAASGEAQMLELACTSWAATSELDADSEDDEEAAARHSLERGMTWARWAFDELILPATSVSFLSKDSFLIPRSSRASPVIPVLLAVDPRVFRSEARPRGAPTPRRVDPAGDAACRGRVVAAGVVASETSTSASIEAARQPAEDRAISTETAAAIATTERDSLASRLALTEAEIEKLRTAAASAEEAAERAKNVAATVETTP
jgi:hypothetical protein